MKTPDFVADIKVGCKTIEDIKKWLACWAVTYTDECSGECETCEYDVGEKESVGMGGKTLAYIQHLESRLAQAERERDAAVGDLQEAARDGAVCTACKHDEEFAEACAEADFDCKQCKQPCMCKTCNANSNYEWIGLCEENTHDQP